MDPLQTARTEALARIAALAAARDDIVAASEGSNADDEHDPEGATIAFERQQAAALLAQAVATLASLDEALVRRAAGSYGTCTGCGSPIGDERLTARPGTTLCIHCAAHPR